MEVQALVPTPSVCQELIVEGPPAETVEQFIAPPFNHDPHFHSIEENIDELERRIKTEERRYVSLMENSHYY